MRPSGRAPDEIRALSFATDFTKHAEGSVLTSFGDTRVLCTASVESGVPRWLRGQGKGWVTAEYGMLPRSTHSRTVTLDCDVLQADGGTRTAAISGAYVALKIALDRLCRAHNLKRHPLHGQIAAVSVGIFSGTPVLDLDYAEDSQAETDMNVVMNDAGRFVEVQGTAEGHAFTRDEFDNLLELAHAGIRDIIAAQNAAIEASGD